MKLLSWAEINSLAYTVHRKSKPKAGAEMQQQKNAWLWFLGLLASPPASLPFDPFLFLPFYLLLLSGHSLCPALWPLDSPSFITVCAHLSSCLIPSGWPGIRCHFDSPEIPGERPAWDTTENSPGTGTRPRTIMGTAAGLSWAKLSKGTLGGKMSFN